MSKCIVRSLDTKKNQLLTIAGPARHEAQSPHSTQHQQPHCDDGEVPTRFSCFYTLRRARPRNPPQPPDDPHSADNVDMSTSE